MDDAMQAEPVDNEGAAPRIDGFYGEIPRLPPVTRRKSGVIKTVGALFTLVTLLVYLVNVFGV